MMKIKMSFFPQAIRVLNENTAQGASLFPSLTPPVQDKQPTLSYTILLSYSATH